MKRSHAGGDATIEDAAAGPGGIAPRILIAIWLISAPALCLIYMMMPPSPDQAQFDYMAWMSAQGLPYYAQSFDMNWPGAMVLHELGIRLFGVHAWTWRLTDFLLMEGLALLIALFIRRAGFRLAPALFLALFPVLYVTGGFWLVGQRDIIATGFLLAACAMVLPGGRAEGAKIAVAGALIACAVLIRPTFLSFLIGVMALEALPLRSPAPRSISRLVRGVTLALGFAVPVLAIVAAGAALGNLDDWYAQSIQFSLSVYSGDPPQSMTGTAWQLFVSSWHWLTVLGTLGLLLWIARDGVSHASALVVGAGLTILVSYIVQNKGFVYHLGGFLTILTLLLAIAGDRLMALRNGATGRLSRLGLTAALALAMVVVFGGTAKKLSGMSGAMADLATGRFELINIPGRLTEDERRAMIALIQDGGGPQDRMVQYGILYEIPYRAQRLPSFRFINANAFDLMSESYVHYAAWTVEVAEDLRDHPPAFVLLERKFVQGDAPPFIPVDDARPMLALVLEQISEGYAVVFTTDTAILLRKEARP
jgi:hypothetical protein